MDAKDQARSAAGAAQEPHAPRRFTRHIDCAPPEPARASAPERPEPLPRTARGGR